MSSLSKLEAAYFAGTKPSQEELLGFRKLFSKYENSGLSEDQLVTFAQNARSLNLDLGAELGPDYYTDKLARQITNQRKNLGTEKYYQGDLGAIGGIDAATQYMASRLVLSGIRDINEIGEKTDKAYGIDTSADPNKAAQDFQTWYRSGGWTGQSANSVVDYNGKKYWYTNYGGGDEETIPVLLPFGNVGEPVKMLYNKRTGEQLKQGHDVGYAYANTSISPDNPNARYTIGGTFADNNTGLNVSMVNGIPMFYTSPGPSSSFISKESIGPVLAISSMLVPGLGIAIGGSITSALGLTVSSAVAGAIGTGVLTAIANNGDLKKGALAAATSYFAPAIAGEISDAAGSIFESAAGKKLIENVSAAALRTAALGGNLDEIRNSVLSATAGGMFDVVVSNLPGFQDITDPKTKAAVIASVQNALDAPGDIADKFKSAALSGVTTLGLSKIDIDGKKFSDLSPGQQSIVTTALSRELAGKPLTSDDIFKTVIDAVSKEVRADIQKERAQPEKKAEAEVAPEDLSIPTSGPDLSDTGEPGAEDQEPSDEFGDLFGGATAPPFGGLFGGPGADFFGGPITGGFGELDLTEDIEIPPELVADLYGPTRPVLPELGEEDLTDEDTADILDIIRDSVEAISPKVVSPDIIPGGESLSPISPTIPGLGVEEFFGTKPSTEPFPYTPGEDAEEFEPGDGTVVDTLTGGLGNDLLGGETDEERAERESQELLDIISGGTGNDTTAGGDETVEGGAGNDTVAAVEDLEGFPDAATKEQYQGNYGAYQRDLARVALEEQEAVRSSEAAAEAEELDRAKYEDLKDIFPDYETYKFYNGDVYAYRADQQTERERLADELGFPSVELYDLYQGDIERYQQEEAEYSGFPDYATYLRYNGDFTAYQDDLASAEGWPDAATRDEFGGNKERYAQHLEDERALEESGRQYEIQQKQFRDQLAQERGFPDDETYQQFGGDLDAYLATLPPSFPEDTLGGGQDTTDGGWDIVDGGVETIVGGNGNDTLVGGDETLDGGDGNDILEPITCPEGFEYDAELGVCMPITEEEPDLDVEQDVEEEVEEEVTPTCPPGFVYDPTTDSCVPVKAEPEVIECEEGYVYDAQLGMCVPESIEPPEPIECEEGYVYDPITQTCVPEVIEPPEPVECEEGYVYDPISKTCVPEIVEPPEPIECEEGYVYDPVSKTCVPEAIEPPEIIECEEGYVYDPVQKICVPEAVEPPETIECEEGYVYDPVTKTCVPETVTPPPIQCPEGYVYDPVQRSCVKKVVQPPPPPRPPRPQPPKKPTLQGLPSALNWQQFLAQQAALGPMFQPFIAGAQQPSSQAGAGGPRFEAFYANIPGYKPFDVRQFSSDFYDEE